ncbi:hypothetical protein GCM10028798_28900 [Humibacter antri]
MVQRLSTTQWRVCDRRWSNQDARCLLGFIEKKGDRFELMELGHGFHWLTFASLAEAAEHFVGQASGAAPEGNPLVGLQSSADAREVGHG